MPALHDPILSKEQAKQEAKLLTALLRKHGKPVNNNLHKAVDSKGEVIYSSVEGDTIKSIHTIKNHQQSFVCKLNNGTTRHALSVMNHHVNEHGKLSSDSIQTSGGKALWCKWVKSNPAGINFHYTHTDNGKSIQTPVNSTNIDHHSDKIWSKTHGLDVILHAIKATKGND